MWLGGEGAGKAIADVLTGIINPSGKLTETFPTHLRTDMNYPGDGLKVQYNEGIAIGYRYYDNHPSEVVYPFGHGLSYTQFAIAPPQVELTDHSLHIHTTVSNTGEYDGHEVIQLYVGKPVSCITRPLKELKAFRKVFIRHRETESLTISIPLADLAYYNILLNKWIIEPGEYDLYIATSSQDIKHKVQFVLTTTIPYTINSTATGMIG